ncbi:MAG: chorismate synthase, partial [Clostridia bacterium]|nr:chorismate synthase [Clostridia bacterium]
SLSTARKEKDKAEIISGVYRGRTTGTPITVLIRNEDVRSGDYSPMENIARPGHADYTGYVKYAGFNDPRGGGHFSGRITAGLVSVGAIALSALKRRGITVATHIARCAGIADRAFFDFPADAEKLNRSDFAVLDDEAAERMKAKILEAREDGDSVGGVLETVVLGLPAGIGEPWFDSMESVLSHILFSIPGVKGVEFGDGFALCEFRGSEANGSIRVKHGEIRMENDRMGGIFGGITSGDPLKIRIAVKPTPSIYKAQKTVDFRSGTNEILQIAGRHDPAIVHRCRVVADSCVALALCDLLTEKYGTDFLGEHE